MNVAMVHDWKFKKEADIGAAMRTASELVTGFKKNHPGVQLSLWLKDQGDPLHYWHITVFDSKESLEKARKSPEIDKFVEHFYPFMDQSTHNYPCTDVVLVGENQLKDMALQL